MIRHGLLGLMLLAGAAGACLAQTGLSPEARLERLPALMDKLQRSQQEVEGKQAMLLSYSQSVTGSDRTRMFIEERLRDLVRSQKDNASLYGEFRASLQAVGKIASGPRVDAVETAQRGLESAHGKLVGAFGNFYERLVNATTPALMNATTPAQVAPVAPAGGNVGFAFGGAAPVGAAPPPGLPANGLPPQWPPAMPPVAAGDGPASDTGAPAAITPDNQMQAMPMAPDDGEAAYRKTMGEIQAVLASETATSAQKQAAYARFMELKKTRRDRH